MRRPQHGPRRDSRAESTPAPPGPERAAGGRRLLLATKNPGKVAELAELLEGHPFEVLGLEVAGPLPAPVEDGATFAANARKKAIHYSRLVPHLVLADDSGLEIDALGGEPGVRSARLGGVSATDDDRNKLVLRRLEGVPWERRDARFACVLALGLRGRVVAAFEGTCEGKIAFEPTGGGGFGYDPIFYHPRMDRTFADMTREEKARVSHRGLALDRAIGWLVEHFDQRPES